ncbi:hypothetical protein, partial [Bradyrhizobium sp. Leo121]|uniref:hypothetical protein n=1 Tax=Bradyrhizobium sp. Leo121 TaxID=1571195 RepID=UPI001A9202AB
TAKAECFLCDEWTGQITLESLVNFSPPVIPGRCEASSPESIQPLSMPRNGFRARATRAPE